MTLMRKLIGYTHVSLGGEIGSPNLWAEPYLDHEHSEYATRVLFAADALLLGRRTCEGFSVAYPAMADDLAEGRAVAREGRPAHPTSSSTG
jgi:hypothetical protein